MEVKRLAVVIPAFNEQGIVKTLETLYTQLLPYPGTHVFVVDNGSTDNTKGIIEQFAQTHKDFPMTILSEKQKGTGAASDTGFRYAIKMGYPVIARTDADSVPESHWIAKILHLFDGPNPPRLLGGMTVALHDMHHKPIDSILVPLVARTSPHILALQRRTTRYNRRAIGANMATTAETYLAVGGFPRSAINELDEDVAYSKKVIDKFGKKSVKIDWGLKVQTSSRRTRAYGIIGIMQYYLFPSKRDGDIDVR